MRGDKNRRSRLTSLLIWALVMIALTFVMNYFATPALSSLKLHISECFVTAVHKCLLYLKSY